MKIPRIAFARISLAALFILALIALPSLDEGNDSAYALGLSGQAASDCSITVDAKGSGQVTVMQSNGQPVALEKGSAQIQLPCGDGVTLTAEPAARWRFDHWQGVPAADRWRQTITVSAPVEATAVFVPRAVTLEPLETPYYDRGGNLVTQEERLEPLWRPFTEHRPAASNAQPVIDVWYGQTQNFGQVGTPQQWINILGNVEDPDGELLKSFSYTLNGGPSRALSYGGSGSLNDTRRLFNPGDFNIDIDKDDLRPLPNTNEIVITAEDSLGVKNVFATTVTYDAGEVWPIPYKIDWSTANSIQEKVQIVDGKWGLSAAGVQPLETGYDRILAIGEGSFDGPGWTEFEATVQVTLNGISDEGFVGNQIAPALSVVMRWQGHTDTPKECEQPKCGYLPVGVASWYQWDRTDPARKKADFSLWTNPGNPTPDPKGLQLEFGKTYNWKVRVDNSVGPEGMYYLWVWPAGEPEPGFSEYLISMAGNRDKSLESGSLLLLSHHVNVTFGDVQICPLGGCPGPVISDIAAQPGINDATVAWKTDTSTTGRFEYWSDPNDVKTVTLDTLTTDHSLQLLNLEPETQYEYQIFAVDKFDGESSSAIATFTTEPVPPDTFTLQVTTAGTGSVTVSPEKVEYLFGEQVTLTAVPGGPKTYFSGWSLGAAGSENPLVLIMTDNTEIQATFEQYQVGDFGYFLPMTLRN